jgi:hypothetical protein
MDCPLMVLRTTPTHRVNYWKCAHPENLKPEMELEDAEKGVLPTCPLLKGQMLLRVSEGVKVQ